MHPLKWSENKQFLIDKNPFENLKVDDWSRLDQIENRTSCWKCGKSRKYYCYMCFVPVKELQGKIPSVKLPIKIDIIKHKHEIDGKSTASHAAILAPFDVKVYTYPHIPDYNMDEKVLLVYPSKNAKSVEELLSCHTDIKLSDYITRVILIDSTWNQSKGIYKDERLQKLPTIILKNRISQFWRHQKGSPRWYLSTIEAIHQLVNEIEILTSGQSECNKYDNLLYFFCFMYSKIHTYYNHDKLLSYQRPLQ